MRRVYLVSYDLHAPRREYDGLIGELKSRKGWWHHLDSVWLIATDETADQLYRRLRRHIDDDDEILVMRVCNDSQGWLPGRAWKWINAHVARCR
jgi:hypothetical protein